MGVNAEMNEEDTGDDVLEEVMKEPHVAGALGWPARPPLAVWLWWREGVVSGTVRT